MRTLLIDDEKPSLERLSSLLQQRCAETVQIVGQCQTINDSLSAIQRLKPELVFLDVELKLDGNRTCFDLLGGVANIDFSVVFVTGFEQYALRAFQVDAIDYLLKPVDADKLVKAVNKVKSRSHQDQTEYHKQLQKAVDERERNVKRIGLPTANGLKFIDLEDIVYCASHEGRVKFFGLKDKELGIDYESLSKYERDLIRSGFCRIHEAYLINMAYLKAYINGRGGLVEMIDGTKLNVSNQRKAEFLGRVRSGDF